MIEKVLDIVSIRLVREGSIPYEKAGVKKELITSPKEAVKFTIPFFEEADREKILCMCMSSSGEPVNISLVAIGGIAQCGVSIPDLLKTAILCNSPGMLLFHNYPSGSTKPSEEDLQITNRVEAACKIMGIKLLDHIIVGDNGEYFSFKEENILKGDEKV